MEQNMAIPPVKIKQEPPDYEENTPEFAETLPALFESVNEEAVPTMLLQVQYIQQEQNVFKVLVPQSTSCVDYNEQQTPLEKTNNDCKNNDDSPQLNSQQKSYDNLQGMKPVICQIQEAKTFEEQWQEETPVLTTFSDLSSQFKTVKSVVKLPVGLDSAMGATKKPSQSLQSSQTPQTQNNLSTLLPSEDGDKNQEPPVLSPEPMEKTQNNEEIAVTKSPPPVLVPMKPIPYPTALLKAAPPRPSTPVQRPLPSWTPPIVPQVVEDVKPNVKELERLLSLKSAIKTDDKMDEDQDVKQKVRNNNNFTSSSSDSDETDSSSSSPSSSSSSSSSDSENEVAEKPPRLSPVEKDKAKPKVNRTKKQIKPILPKEEPIESSEIPQNTTPAPITSESNKEIISETKPIIESNELEIIKESEPKRDIHHNLRPKKPNPILQSLKRVKRADKPPVIPRIPRVKAIKPPPKPKPIVEKKKKPIPPAAVSVAPAVSLPLFKPRPKLLPTSKNQCARVLSNAKSQALTLSQQRKNTSKAFSHVKKQTSEKWNEEILPPNDEDEDSSSSSSSDEDSYLDHVMNVNTTTQINSNFDPRKKVFNEPIKPNNKRGGPYRKTLLPVRDFNYTIRHDEHPPSSRICSSPDLFQQSLGGDWLDFDRNMDQSSSTKARRIPPQIPKLDAETLTKLLEKRKPIEITKPKPLTSDLNNQKKTPTPPPPNLSGPVPIVKQTKTYEIPDKPPPLEIPTCEEIVITAPIINYRPKRSDDFFYKGIYDNELREKRHKHRKHLDKRIDLMMKSSDTSEDTSNDSSLFEKNTSRQNNLKKNLMSSPTLSTAQSLLELAESLVQSNTPEPIDLPLKPIEPKKPILPKRQLIYAPPPKPEHSKSNPVETPKTSTTTSVQTEKVNDTKISTLTEPEALKKSETLTKYNFPTTETINKDGKREVTIMIPQNCFQMKDGQIIVPKDLLMPHLSKGGQVRLMFQNPPNAETDEKKDLTSLSPTTTTVTKNTPVTTSKPGTSTNQQEIKSPIVDNKIVTQVAAQKTIPLLQKNKPTILPGTKIVIKKPYSVNQKPMLQLVQEALKNQGKIGQQIKIVVPKNQLTGNESAQAKLSKASQLLTSMASNIAKVHKTQPNPILSPTTQSVTSTVSNSEPIFKPIFSNHPFIDSYQKILTKSIVAPTIVKVPAPIATSTPTTKLNATPTILRNTTSAAILRTTPPAAILRTTPPAAILRTTQSAAILRTTPSAAILRTTPSATILRTTPSAAILRATPSPTIVKNIPRAINIPVTSNLSIDATPVVLSQNKVPGSKQPLVLDAASLEKFSKNPTGTITINNPKNIAGPLIMTSKGQRFLLIPQTSTGTVKTNVSTKSNIVPSPKTEVEISRPIKEEITIPPPKAIELKSVLKPAPQKKIVYIQPRQQQPLLPKPVIQSKLDVINNGQIPQEIGKTPSQENVQEPFVTQQIIEDELGRQYLYEGGGEGLFFNPITQQMMFDPSNYKLINDPTNEKTNEEQETAIKDGVQQPPTVQDSLNPQSMDQQATVQDSMVQQQSMVQESMDQQQSMVQYSMDQHSMVQEPIIQEAKTQNSTNQEDEVHDRMVQNPMSQLLGLAALQAAVDQQLMQEELAEQLLQMNNFGSDEQPIDQQIVHETMDHLQTMVDQPIFQENISTEELSNQVLEEQRQSNQQAAQEETFQELPLQQANQDFLMEQGPPEQLFEDEPHQEAKQEQSIEIENNPEQKNENQIFPDQLNQEHTLEEARVNQTQSIEVETHQEQSNENQTLEDQFVVDDSKQEPILEDHTLLVGQKTSHIFEHEPFNQELLVQEKCEQELDQQVNQEQELVEIPNNHSDQAELTTEQVEEDELLIEQVEEDELPIEQVDQDELFYDDFDQDELTQEGVDQSHEMHKESDKSQLIEVQVDPSQISNEDVDHIQINQEQILNEQVHHDQLINEQFEHSQLIHEQVDQGQIQQEGLNQGQIIHEEVNGQLMLEQFAENQLMHKQVDENILIHEQVDERKFLLEHDDPGQLIQEEVNPSQSFPEETDPSPSIHEEVDPRPSINEEVDPRPSIHEEVDPSQLNDKVNPNQADASQLIHEEIDHNQLLEEQADQGQKINEQVHHSLLLNEQNDQRQLIHESIDQGEIQHDVRLINQGQLGQEEVKQVTLLQGEVEQVDQVQLIHDQSNQQFTEQQSNKEHFIQEQGNHELSRQETNQELMKSNQEQLHQELLEEQEGQLDYTNEVNFQQSTQSNQEILQQSVHKGLADQFIIDNCAQKLVQDSNNQEILQNQLLQHLVNQQQGVADDSDPQVVTEEIIQQDYFQEQSLDETDQQTFYLEDGTQITPELYKQIVSGQFIYQEGIDDVNTLQLNQNLVDDGLNPPVYEKVIQEPVDDSTIQSQVPQVEVQTEMSQNSVIENEPQELITQTANQFEINQEMADIYKELQIPIETLVETPNSDNLIQQSPEQISFINSFISDGGQFNDMLQFNEFGVTSTNITSLGSGDHKRKSSDNSDQPPLKKSLLNTSISDEVTSAVVGTTNSVITMEKRVKANTSPILPDCNNSFLITTKSNRTYDTKMKNSLNGSENLHHGTNDFFVTESVPNALENQTSTNVS